MARVWIPQLQEMDPFGLPEDRCSMWEEKPLVLSHLYKRICTHTIVCALSLLKDTYTNWHALAHIFYMRTYTRPQLLGPVPGFALRAVLDLISNAQHFHSPALGAFGFDHSWQAWRAAASAGPAKACVEVFVWGQSGPELWHWLFRLPAKTQ